MGSRLGMGLVWLTILAGCTGDDGAGGAPGVTTGMDAAATTFTFDADASATDAEAGSTGTDADAAGTDANTTTASMTTSGTGDAADAGGDASVVEVPCLGDYEVNDADELAAIADCTIITGELLIERLLSTPDSVSLPVLREIQGRLIVSGNNYLKTLSLPALTRVGGMVSFAGFVWLEELRLDALQSVGMLSVGRWPLSELHLPALQSVTGDVQVYWSADMQRIRMPMLQSVGGDLWLRYHEVLSEIDFPMLTHVGDSVEVTENPALPSCQVDALVAGLSEFEGSVDNDMNDDAATCQ